MSAFMPQAAGPEEELLPGVGVLLEVFPPVQWSRPSGYWPKLEGLGRSCADAGRGEAGASSLGWPQPGILC